METTIFSTPAAIGIPSFVVPPTARQPKRNRLVVVSVMTPSTSTKGLNAEATSSYNRVATPIKTVYNDNWLERASISYLSKAVQDVAGMRNEENGYESLVVAARMVFQTFDPIKQRQLVGKALQSAIPKPISFMIKKVMPPSKLSREYFAVFTTIFFPWLVGPCQVTESEFEGRKERNVVHIKKCRFLESSNCAGMCTNLCKMPTQEFIKNSFGIPINMVPNFDDMSCDMIYGQDPPSIKDDPAFKQPCYKICYYIEIREITKKQIKPSYQTVKVM